MPRWLAWRMDELLNSLLEYSHLGLADLRMTPVSLDDVLDEPGARGGGGGAGLTISRRIVERHGGQMWVRSAPDQGTTFYFTV